MSDNSKKLPVSRRTFLGLLGGGLAALLGGSRAFKAAKVVEQAAAPVIQQVPGMPSWFPALVTKIKTQGTKTREPSYGDFTSGGNTETIYVLKDKSLPGGDIRLYENEATGAISVTGRGDEFQQVSFEYIPGENIVKTDQLGQRGVVTEQPTFDASAQTQSAARADQRGGFLGNKDTTDDLMGEHSVKVNEQGTFEAGEFAKGERYDIENFGGIDDLQGGVTSWEKLAKGGSKSEEAEKAVEEFIKRQTNPNIVDDFAEGGRVNLLHGGIVSKRRDSFYNGMGSLFKERI